MSEDLEMDVVELAEAIRKTRECKHDLETITKKGFTADARKIVKQITTCKHGCGYYVVKVISEEPVSEDAIWR